MRNKLLLYERILGLFKVKNKYNQFELYYWGKMTAFCLHCGSMALCYIYVLFIFQLWTISYLENNTHNV